MTSYSCGYFEAMDKYAESLKFRGFMLLSAAVEQCKKRGMNLTEQDLIDCGFLSPPWIVSGPSQLTKEAVEQGVIHGDFGVHYLEEKDFLPLMEYLIHHPRLAKVIREKEAKSMQVQSEIRAEGLRLQAKQLQEARREAEIEKNMRMASGREKAYVEERQKVAKAQATTVRRSGYVWASIFLAFTLYNIIGCLSEAF